MALSLRFNVYFKVLVVASSSMMSLALSACGGASLASLSKGSPLNSQGTTGTPEVGTLYCVSGTMTGSGTDLCTVTLSAAAPSGGQIMNLYSSSSAVTVPSTVTVPVNVTSVGFTATISSVATAQTVTIMASTGGVSKSFVLQLNAAILALSINATSVAFGDVVVNTSAIQPVTLNSTGTMPVTINSATITGAGFTLSGATFPATFNPGQQSMLYIGFSPLAAGTAAGQLTIASNSSTNGTAMIGLSGTGTAVPPPVAVGVTPTIASTTAGSNQQFAASVTGTSNSAVAWAASGTGCTGASCGTISSSGLYTAPARVPVPATVTITATSAADASKSATASLTIMPPAGTIYYLAPDIDGGKDSNNGLSPSKSWLTPNHSVNCGDVIIATPSSAYSVWNFQPGNWGTVNCPSGNSVAWLMCATFDGCKITSQSGASAGIWIDHSYWGVQGWEVSMISASTYGTCYVLTPSPSNSLEIHHLVLANNICNGSQAGGIAAGRHGLGASADYLAIVGNIVYNSSQSNTECYSGISINNPIAYDSLPGTHIYLAGNFSFDNSDPNPCAAGVPTDGEGLLFDVFDTFQGLAAPYASQAVMDNNMAVANGGPGIQADYNSVGAPPFANIYFRHNTTWGNNGDTNRSTPACGEIISNAVYNSEWFFNLAATSATNTCGTNPTYAYWLGSGNGTDHIYQNWGYAASGNNSASPGSTGFSFGPNNIFGTDPQFVNPIPPGVPNCSGTANVPGCMTSVIANFTPTNAAAVGYGYQIPSSAPTFDPLFPQWLCNVNLPPGLVTMGCKSQP